jgi:hypothetical protein
MFMSICLPKLFAWMGPTASTSNENPVFFLDRGEKSTLKRMMISPWI